MKVARGDCRTPKVFQVERLREAVEQSLAALLRTTGAMMMLSSSTRADGERLSDHVRSTHHVDVLVARRLALRARLPPRRPPTNLKWAVRPAPPRGGG